MEEVVAVSGYMGSWTGQVAWSGQSTHPERPQYGRRITLAMHSPITRIVM
jgi:hypothetical protein